MSFRRQYKIASYTYSQCDVPLDVLSKHLKEKAGTKFGWHLIVAADHASTDNDQNVGVHRHVMQEYNCKSFETENARYWDIKFEGKTYHPHFEPVKKKAECLQYCMKDGNYIFDGTYKEAPFTPDVYLQANKGKQGYGFTYMATEIKKGKTLDELDDVVPGLVLNNKRKLEDYIVFQAQKKERATIKPTFYGFEDVDDPEWQRVVDWANENFLKPRNPKQKQLWIYSNKGNMGKTHPWAVTLTEFYKRYNWLAGAPKQGLDLKTANYILMDDFKGGEFITTLKNIVQMMGFSVDYKYGTIEDYNKNIPIIITANHSIRDVYKNCNSKDIESCELRFEMIEVFNYCELVPKKAPPQVLVPATPEQPTRVAVPVPTFDEDLIESSEDTEELSEYSKMEKLKGKI